MSGRPFVPPGMTGIRSIAYVLLRGAHLLITAAALPLAVHYVMSRNAVGAPAGLALGLGIAGILLSAMLFIALEQFSYPLTLGWGFMATASFVFNAWTGATLGSFSLAYGGYSIIMSALTAQILVIAAATVMAFVVPLRRRFLPGLPSWYAWFLLGVAVALAVLWLLVHRPLVGELAGESRLWKRALYLSAFAVDVFFDMKTLKEGSVLGDSAMRKSKTTWSVYEAWNPPMVIMLLLSILGAMAVMMIPADS